MPEILDSIKGINILETIANYPIAFDTGHNAVAEEVEEEELEHVYDERSFWYDVMENPDEYWDREFTISEGVFTYWVPRVPGLVFTPLAKVMRQFAKSMPLDESHKSYGEVNHVLRPAGKSAMVSGGSGTLKLPPDSNYNTMGCISFSSDASIGIPLLISEEVRLHHKLTDGCTITIKGARWRKMAIEWSSKFPIVSGVPRGYMVVDRPEMIKKSLNHYGIMIQPFTVMEQNDNGLYDYVFVTVNAADKDHRKQAIAFFDKYCSVDNHKGSYLLAIDPADPYFDAPFILPKDIENLDKYGKSQMDLMKKRITEDSFGGPTLEKLAGIIPQFYQTADDVYRLAANAGIAAASIPDDSAKKMTIVLLEKAATEGKLPLLVQLITKDFPETLYV